MHDREGREWLRCVALVMSDIRRIVSVVHNVAGRRNKGELKS